ncbi:LysM peptidoglycan-binding domain-containing protein [Flavitalea sp. BT771]|uniref:LysM peptidoglycan-binding domain-containing protein n=1 Tax=Flavitalea sp. BT771 TaxID=3063329 RepID=UPI0026E27747|nr:LysM peptidoglycan-binding domain-containing protein [Flavitalea sp. BT771]MDO6429849.1 LysM peptidoglycan-binding domain-containing protein [Flavitalea sp. BT771]MDV6218023.1 LysM peptidoglycan-binding domain-containing protein [Flavitalea sp. BT771]
MKTVHAQSDELNVQGQTGNLYLQHAVVAKETWYSIGRLYNLPPATLATYNKLAMTQPLSIGQQLQIPLTAVNFSQNGLKAAGESLVPLYYIIQEKEWMYRISVNHNKVPITSLEKWNNINKDQVRPGMHIIVGYLKVKTALSALATKAGGAPVAAGTGTLAKPADKTEKPAESAAKQAEKTTDKTTDKTVQRVDKPAEKMAEKAADKMDKAAEKTADKMDKTADKQVEKTEKPGGTTIAPPATTNVAPAITKPAATTTPPVSSSGKSFNGGFFKSDFSDGGKSAEGAAGTFKSSSGWQDGKYYALMNNVPVGAIVRVTVSSSGKIVYAKVLGQLPDMKESVGLTIRISNAAASELGEGDGKFNVTVRY